MSLVKRMRSPVPICVRGAIPAPVSEGIGRGLPDGMEPSPLLTSAARLEPVNEGEAGRSRLALLALNRFPCRNQEGFLNSILPGNFALFNRF